MSSDHSSPESPSNQTVDPKPGTWGARKRTPCKLCGVEIIQRLSGKREYCGYSCAVRGRHGLPPDPNRASPPTPPGNITAARPREVIRVQATTKTRPAVCEECKKDYLARKHAPQRFCSRSCKAIHQRRTAKEEGRFGGGRKHTGENKPCEVCGLSVYVKVWQVKAGWGRFCSKACFDVWQGRNTVECLCEWCDKPYAVSPSKSKVQRFCSFPCQAEGRRTRALDRTHNGRRVHQTKDGYIYVWEPDHPRSATYGGWYAEHRLVVERAIGRVLETEEIVHHKDGRKDFNDLSNLQVVTEVEHQILTTRQIVERRKADAAELATLRAFKAEVEAKGVIR